MRRPAVQRRRGRERLWPPRDIPYELREQTRRLTWRMTPAEHAAWARERAFERLAANRELDAIAGLLVDLNALGCFPFKSDGDGPYVIRPEAVEAILHAANALAGDCYHCAFRNRETLAGLIQESASLALHGPTLESFADADARIEARINASRAVQLGRFKAVKKALSVDNPMTGGRPRSPYDPRKAFYGGFGHHKDLDELCEKADAAEMYAFIDEVTELPDDVDWRIWVHLTALNEWFYDVRVGRGPKGTIEWLIEMRRAEEAFDDSRAAEFTARAEWADKYSYFPAFVLEWDWPAPGVPLKPKVDAMVLERMMRPVKEAVP